MLKLNAKSILPQRAMAPIIVSLVLVCLALSFMLCFYLSENFFFDKIWYKKSALHGYYNRWYYDTEKIHLNWLEQELVRRREQDLTDLLAGKVWVKNPGVKTIAVIGDSYVYGVGIRQSQRFSERLAPELKKLGISAEVYTFAESGNSILDALALYQLVKKQLNPDLVVIGIVSNDLFFNYERYPGDTENRERFGKYCSGELYAATSDFNQNYTGYISAAKESFSSRWSNRCYLSEAAKILGHDSRVIYFNFTSKHASSVCHRYDYSDEQQLMDIYSAAIEQHGLRGLSHAALDSQGQVSVSPAEGHPSSSTHQRYATELAQYIAKIGIKD